MLEFYLKGGVLMHPILVASIIAFTITIERCWFFWRMRTGKIALRFELIENLLIKGDEREAMAIATSMTGPIGKILQAGLKEPGESHALAEERMAICGNDVSRETGKGLSLLALIPPVSTMLGLLGTVIGLVMAFQKISQIEGTHSPALLASGIWIALITTVAGMIVAILSLIAHHYLQSRSDNLIFQIEHFGNRLLLLLKKTRAMQEAEAAAFDSESNPFRMAYPKGRP